MFGLFVAGAIARTVAGETADDRVARLNIAFDPKAREAADAAGPVASTGEQPTGEQPTGEFTLDDMLHLRTVVVTARRQPMIERDLLTPAGRLDLAKKRYLTPVYQRTFGPLSQVAAYYFDFLATLGGWHPNDAEAMVLYEDDAQKRRNTEMAELINLDRLGALEPDQVGLGKPLERSPVKAGILVNSGSTP